MSWMMSNCQGELIKFCLSWVNLIWTNLGDKACVVQRISWLMNIECIKVVYVSAEGHDVRDDFSMHINNVQ